MRGVVAGLLLLSTLLHVAGSNAETRDGGARAMLAEQGGHRMSLGVNVAKLDDFTGQVRATARSSLRPHPLHTPTCAANEHAFGVREARPVGLACERACARVFSGRLRTSR